MELIVNSSKKTDKIQIAPNSNPIPTVRLLKALGYADNALPVAEILAKYHNLSGVWTVLSPVHWEATHNDALMMPGGAASRDVFDAFQAFVAEVDMRLHYHDASTWLLQCDAHALPDTKPLHQVLQRSMRPILKALEKDPFWLRFLTEAQMFLSRYQQSINGVWFWGMHACAAPSNKPLVIWDDKAWVSLAERISTQVNLYHAGMNLPKNAVCFVPECTPESVKALEVQLEKQIAKQKINWSFNNTDYITQPKSLWARFWSKKHED